MSSTGRRERGERLKKAAKKAGFTSDQIGELLGVEGGTVRGWWRGASEPSIDMLTHYARLTLVSVSYLIEGDRPMGPSGTLQEWLLRYAELIRQGVPPLEAINQITGVSSVGDPGIPEDRLTPEEREILAGEATAMQAVLEEASGGQWDRLNDEQRLAVLRLIETMAPGDTAGEES
jgi:transcriptional regulator with XRE-family HTH domain